VSRQKSKQSIGVYGIIGFPPDQDINEKIDAAYNYRATPEVLFMECANWSNRKKSTNNLLRAH